MVDLTTVKTDAQKIEAELGFVKANWTKLSLIVIVAFVLGVVVGHLI